MVYLLFETTMPALYSASHSTLAPSKVRNDVHSLPLLSVLFFSLVFIKPSSSTIVPVPVPAVATEASSAFRVIWNAPSQVCEKCGGLPLERYGIEANANESFIGETIACLYSGSFGLWPKLNVSLNATPCWTGQTPCSWTPWSTIDVLENGGVPQAANLTLHLEKVSTDVVRAIPDSTFSGMIILDFEEWRPVLSSNFDALSYNIVYSRSLVQNKHPEWNASRVQTTAAAEFNTAALSFFVQTVRTIRKLRPVAKIGYYEWPSDSGVEVDDMLQELWKEVDVMAPSVYPRYTDVNRQANWTIGKILESQRVQKKYGRRGSVVMAYTRAFVQNQQVLSREQLATQIQIAAGLGAEGIILWGSSADYATGCGQREPHGPAAGSCMQVAKELESVAGPLVFSCQQNRNACRATHCSGHGRCIDYNGEASQLESVCLTTLPVLSCRCDTDWLGADCGSFVH